MGPDFSRRWTHQCSSSQLGPSFDDACGTCEVDGSRGQVPLPKLQASDCRAWLASGFAWGLPPGRASRWLETPLWRFPAPFRSAAVGEARILRFRLQARGSLSAHIVSLRDGPLSLLHGMDFFLSRFQKYGASTLSRAKGTGARLRADGSPDRQATWRDALG